LVSEAHVQPISETTQHHSVNQVDTITAKVYDNRMVSGFMDYPRITLAQCGRAAALLCCAEVNDQQQGLEDGL
jgi:hypothetical protein